MVLHSLSLCAGVAGIDLGLRIADPSIRTVCYVEWAKFPATVIAARIADQALDEAPIWDDVGTFDGRPWCGVVDIVTAGFPCQPVSLAGQRKGMADERFIWGDVARIIGEIQPERVLLENVPGILSADNGRFLGRVLGDLAELRYDTEWDLFSAEETTAPHLRKRWFLLAYRNESGFGARQRDLDDSGRELGNAEHQRSQEPKGIADYFSQDAAERCTSVYPPARNDFVSWQGIDASAQPSIRRVVNGLAAGLDQSLFAYGPDRLRAVGNGVVPLSVALAWIELNRRIGG